MTSGSVSRRYARALYELAVEDDRATPVGEQLREVGKGVEIAGPEALSEGTLSLDARREIGSRLAERVGAETILGRFVRLVAERDRLAHLPEIADWYGRLEDEAAGRVRATITSATELSAAAVEAIRAVFRKIAEREVLARVTTEPELIGGAIVELEGRVYDGSVRTALSRLAARMAGTNGSAHGLGPREGKGKNDADQSV